MIVKLVGGIYLIFLGVKSWFKQYQVMDTTVKNHKCSKGLFCEAFLVGATNPKAIAFYTALFPQFIVLEEPILAQFIVLASTFALVSLNALLIYAVMASKLRYFLIKDMLIKRFNKMMGGIFMTYGVTLLFHSRT